jgi:hypothetical protein
MSLKGEKDVQIKLTQYVQRVITDCDIHTALWLESQMHVIDLNQVAIIDHVPLLKLDRLKYQASVNLQHLE